MPLIPLRLTIPLQPLLAPLRWLTAHHWLRAADVDACLRFLQPAWALTRIHARVEARRWVAEDMLAILPDWAGEGALRDQVLVHNPARLYGFPPVARAE